MKTYIIKAAGGNPTVIRTIKSELTRTNYELFGGELMLKNEKFGVEQAGFLIKKQDSRYHFEMSGGEFCGNAARSAALVISLLENTQENSFTMSGFENEVSSYVKKIDDLKFEVTCDFPGLPLTITNKMVAGIQVKIVDLGGIVHVVIDSLFPKESHKEEHLKILKELSLGDRDAVGVIWINRTKDGISIDPVVWVKSIDTYFHETSCGSGSIAVSATTGESSIIQPSGEVISVEINDLKVTLKSEMQIAFEEDVSDD